MISSCFVFTIFGVVVCHELWEIALWAPVVVFVIFIFTNYYVGLGTATRATLVFLFSLLKLAFAKLLVTLYNILRSGLDFQILLSVNFNYLFLNICRSLEQKCFRVSTVNCF